MSLFIAVPVDWSETILAQGYRASRRGHVPASDSAERARNNYRRHFTGKMDVIVVDDKADGFPLVVKVGSGFHINSTTLDPKFLSKLSEDKQDVHSTGRTGRWGGTPQNGFYLVVPENRSGWTLTALKETLAWAETETEARDIAKKTYPDVKRFETYRARYYGAAATSLMHSEIHVDRRTNGKWKLWS